MSKNKRSTIESLAENGGLVRAGADVGTTQPIDNGVWDTEPVLPPPYPPKALALIYEKNTVARKSIDIFGSNVFGAGWRLETYSGDTESPQLKEAYEFFDRINPEKTFEELIQSFVVDYKNIGYAGFEVARNKLTGKPERIYNMPIATIRVAQGGSSKGFRTGQRFVQIEDESMPDEKVWYNKYYANKEDRNINNGYNPELNGEGKRTNEVMWFSAPNPSSRYYGLSPSVTLLKTYLLNQYCQQFNIDQFESGMIQKFAVIVEGAGQLASDSIEGLRAFMEENRSNAKWGRVPILKAAGKDTTIKIEKLTGDFIESSFIETLKFTREDVCIAFGIPPVILGITENSTQANQESQERKFYEKEVKPIEKMLESRFTKMLNDDFGFKDIRLVANTPDYEDKAVENEVAAKQFDRGAMTINEWRSTEGKDAIDGGDEAFIKTPYGIILVKDIPDLTAEVFAEGQATKMSQVITDGLLNFKRQKEAELRNQKILNGTEESEDPYIEPNKKK